MSSLRRFAQTNAAAAPGSPRVGDSSSLPSPSTPTRNTPSTPRTRLVYPISPVTSPSLSASTPFDWEAARAHKPPPYASPLANKRLRGVRNGSPTKGTPSKRVVRKRGFIEHIKSLPSMIAFHMSMFPHNLPLPSSRKSAWIIGGFLHFLHLCARISQIRQIPDSDLGWEDMYKEEENEPWFNWTIPTTFILVSLAILNALYLFTRTRVYQLALASDPVASPHASFVARSKTPSHSSDDHQQPQSKFKLIFSILSGFWRAIIISTRFLLNLSPPKTQERTTFGSSRSERVQQLEVWNPGELEMALFAIYSPVHALLWMAVTSANWMWLMFVMGVTSVQLRALTKSFEALVKDRGIISAEMLHEYDEKFVYPRINPIRKDAAVMTHQAEMVNIWDDSRSRSHHGVGVGVGR
ncbi:hypothetical protein ABKN59_002459 [Abortiporus biennis]